MTPTPPREPFWRRIKPMHLAIVGAILAVVAMSLVDQVTNPEGVPYSGSGSLIERVTSGEIVEVKQTDTKVVGTTADGTKITSYVPSRLVTDIVADIDRACAADGAECSEDLAVRSAPDPSGSLLLTVISMLPFLMLIGLIFYMMRSGGGIFGFGKSKAKTLDPERTTVTFEDVAGVEDAKAELAEVVDFLKNPDKYLEIGARIPRGVLLAGPPGSGKTLLSKAVATEAGVPFFHTSASEFIEMIVGVGASVTGDTPVLVRDEHGTRLVPISDVIDPFYEGDNEGFTVSTPGLTTLGFEPKKSAWRGGYTYFGGSAWQPVERAYRHRVDEIYEIQYLGGTIRTTGDHSIFVRSRQGIVAKAAKDLLPGEILVNLPFKARRDFDPSGQERVRSHSFDGELSAAMTLRTNPERDERIALFDEVMERAEPAPVLALQYGVSATAINQWRRGATQMRAASSRYGAKPIPEEVEVTPELLKLFGYYTAEGRGHPNLGFCFGSHEADLLSDCQALMKQVFGLDAVVRPTEDNSTWLHYYSAPLGRFFSRHCGNGSGNKHIPEILWDLPREYFLAYLKGYSDGDGYTDKGGRLSMSSISQRLIRELAWLCAMHGIKGRIQQCRTVGGRILKNRPLPASEYWTLKIGRSSHPFVSVPGLREHKRPIVRSVERKPYDGYVYDFCGCGNEAFFGGELPVLLHNSRIRDIFAKARAMSPAIVFIDEIDAIGRSRGGANIGGGHDEREQTLNQLLVEMDGFDERSDVIIVAATNRPDVLDPALLRPGRFDRTVILDAPDRTGREAILKVHSRGKPLHPEVNLGVLARETPGMSGADLANVVNEAAIGAVRRSADQIRMRDLRNAVERVIAGPERTSHLMSEDEKWTVAVHETGHALVQHLLPGCDPVVKITIVSRGMALGYTMAIPEREARLKSRGSFRDQIAGLLGGNAAELVFFNEMTTGAANDMGKATEIARKMVTEWGMHDTLGPVVIEAPRLDDPRKLTPLSEATAMAVDAAIRELVEEGRSRATEILQRHRAVVELIARRLMEVETLDATAFAELARPALAAEESAAAAGADPSDDDFVAPRSEAA